MFILKTVLKKVAAGARLEESTMSMNRVADNEARKQG